MSNNCKCYECCLKDNLVKRAKSLNMKLQKLDYEASSDASSSADSDFNILGTQRIQFKERKASLGFLDFIEDLEELLIFILHNYSECKK